MAKTKKKGKKGEDIEEKEVFQTPYTGTDGKWGWFVVFNSFICNMIVDGMQYTFSNLLLPITLSFGTGVTSVALIGSLLSGFYNFSGPIAGALGNKFGFRMVVITGSLVSAGGLMLSYFATSPEYLYFFYGILGGLGFGMIYMASVITTSVYFERYRALAASLSVCGTGVGTFLFSPMGSWLVTTVGWRYALIAEGGMVLVCLICGMSFKPVEIITVVPINHPEASTTSFSYGSVISTNIRTGSVYYPSDVKKTAPNEAYPTFKEALQLQDSPEERRSSEQTTLQTTHKRFSHLDADSVSLRAPRPIYSIMGSVLHTEPDHPPKGKKQKCHRCCRICCFNFWHCRCKKKNLTLGDRPLYRDDIFYGGSLSSLGMYTSSERLKYHLSVTRVPDPQELEEHVARKCCVCHQAVVRTCITMTGVNLLRSKVFAFLCISSFFYTMSLFIPYVFIRKVANDYNIEPEETVWLVSALGICNTVGRLLSGIVKSFLPINAPVLVLVCLLLSGLVGFVLVFIVNMPVLITYSCLYGFFTAPFISLRPIIIVEFLGLEKLTNAFGLVLLSQGVASIIGPPLAGYLEENTGDTLYVIYLSGALLIISTVALLGAILLHRFQGTGCPTSEECTYKKEREIEQVGPMRSEDTADEQLYAIVPPNGGWGWLVVVCAFYCNVVADGIQLTFGIFLKSISSDLKAEYSQVSLAASLMFGIHLLMGPVCCGFNNAFGLRPVTITGSLICGFGIGISYFSTSYLYLCLTFGVIGGNFSSFKKNAYYGLLLVNLLAFGLPVLECKGFSLPLVSQLFNISNSFRIMKPVHVPTVRARSPTEVRKIWCFLSARLNFVLSGIGLGLVYMNTLVITSLYFTSLLPAAIAVVVSGTGVGTMLFAGFGSFLLRWTTWQNSFLLQSLMASSMAVAAISFKPLKPLRVKIASDIRGTSRQEDPRRSERKKSIFERKHTSARNKKTGLLIKKELAANESFVSISSLQKVAQGFVERAISSEFIQSRRKQRCPKCPCRCRRKKKVQEDVLLLREIEEDYLEGKSYVENIEKEKDEISIVSKEPSIISYKTVFTRIDIPEENFKRKIWNRVKVPIIKMFDFHLLKSFYFTLFATIGATQLSSFLIVLIYIKDRSESLGFPEQTSAYFIVAIGASNVFWRLLLGSLSLIPRVHQGALSVSTTVLGGIATIVSGFEAHIVYQLGFCVFFSLAMGSFAVFRMPFLVEFVGVDRIENATGICLLFMGVACIIFPPFFGWLLQVTNSYDPMFITSGSVIVVSGFLQIAVRKKKTLGRI